MTLPITQFENGRPVFGALVSPRPSLFSAERIAEHAEAERNGEPMTMTRAELEQLREQCRENAKCADNGGDLRWALCSSDYHPYVLNFGHWLVRQMDEWDEEDDTAETERPSFSKMAAGEHEFAEMEAAWDVDYRLVD